jgi:hypothetical protein
MFKTCRIILIGCLLFNTLTAQERDSKMLKKLLKKEASPFLLRILKKRNIYHYQFIYTQINRNAENEPEFRNFYLGVDSTDYFNPASMVKLPVSLIALEKLNSLSEYGINESTAMLTDSGFSGQTVVNKDTTAASRLPSVGHYIKKIFIVSDNDAYNRLYEFVGQEMLNTRLKEMGYTGSRITRRFVPMTDEENRHTNPIRFIDSLGRSIYQQSAAYYTGTFDFSRQLLVGNAYYNRQDSLIHAPMDFTRHNSMPLLTLQQMLQAVIFPSSVVAEKRFRINSNQRQMLLTYTSELPSESNYPKFDGNEFFDSYSKFFWFRDGKKGVPGYIRSYNKTGWSYGYLIDVAYITDIKNNVEFMLSGVIYVNSDGILNDDKYDYESVGWPFFRELGEIIYRYELNRKHAYRPVFTDTLKYK